MPFNSFEYQIAEPIQIDKTSYQKDLEPKIKQYYKDHDIVDPVSLSFFTDALLEMMWGQPLITFSLKLNFNGQEYEFLNKPDKHLKEADIPVLRIPDFDRFAKAITQYSETAKVFDRYSYDRKTMFDSLLLNLTEKDLNDPAIFLERATKILASKHLEGLDRGVLYDKVPSLGVRIKVIQEGARSDLESPVSLNTVLVGEVNEEDDLEIPPGTLPVVRFAAIEEGGQKVGYIYAIQDETKTSGADWANKIGLDSQVLLFHESSLRLTKMAMDLHDKYPDQFRNIFGKVPNEVLALKKSPNKFAIALGKYLEINKPGLNNIYPDEGVLANYGITPEIKKEIDISENTIMFAGYCAKRDREIQETLQKRSFRKKIDRELLSITRDGRQYETDEAREYLDALQAVKSPYQLERSKIDGEYRSQLAAYDKEYLETEENPWMEKDEARQNYWKKIRQIDKNLEVDLLLIEPVENISEVTPAAIVSLLVTLTEMQKHGIRKVIVPTNQPFRWQNHAMSAGYRNGGDLDRHEEIHHNITEKFVRTFRALSAQVPGAKIVSFPDSPDIPLEIQLDPSQWSSNQPILQEIISSILTKPL